MPTALKSRGHYTPSKQLRTGSACIELDRGTHSLITSTSSIGSTAFPAVQSNDVYPSRPARNTAGCRQFTY
jgi:hypothetical protein